LRAPVDFGDHASHTYDFDFLVQFKKKKYWFGQKVWKMQQCVLARNALA
jgi:hypothetical protein